MKHIVEINGSSINKLGAGNKALSLNTLKAEGFKVPQSFCLLDSVHMKIFNILSLDAAIKITSKDFDILRIEIKNILTKEFSQEIDFLKKTFRDVKCAVRSSANIEDGINHSWAGVFESFLNVESEKLPDYISECYLSLLSDKVNSYIETTNSKYTDLKMSVIVQEMVNSEISGVLFTRNPINNDNVTIIEMVPGFCDQLVSGLSTPTKFQIINETSRIAKEGDEINIAENEVLDLFEHGLKIKSVFGFDCDIEWAIDAVRNIYFLQCRPLITAQPIMKERLMVSHQSDLLTQDVVLTGVQMHCDFSKYGLPFKYPLIKYQSLSGDIFYPEWQVQIFENVYLNDHEFLELANTLESEINKFIEYLKIFEIETNNVQNQVSCNIIIKEFFNRCLKVVSTIPYFICFEIPLLKRIEQLGYSPDVVKSSKTETVIASIELSRIRNKYYDILNRNVVSLNKELEAELTNFINRFGHLGMLYFGGKPWNISYIISILKNTSDSEILSNKFSDKSKHEELPEILSIIEKMLYYRTIKWESMCKAGYLFSKLFNMYYSDRVPYADLLNMRINEVLDIIDNKYHTNNTNNLLQNGYTLSIGKNSVYLNIHTESSQEVDHFISNDNTVISGQVASLGSSQGIARVILSASINADFNEGDILVTKMSTPDFLPYIQLASAIVTEIGGITSHAAIISRELGKPCIIGVVDATNVFKNGMRINVNANIGTITIMDSYAS